MDGLPASFTTQVRGGQDPVHRARRAPVPAPVELAGPDLRHRQVRVLGGVEHGQDLLPLALAELARVHRLGPWAVHPRRRVGMPVVGIPRPAHQDARTHHAEQRLNALTDSVCQAT